jgi:exosome complex RNA-binding protein Csl4
MAAAGGGASRVVTPGERVGRTAEGVVPGPGVYVRDGTLHAAVLGQLRRDAGPDGVRERAISRSPAR